MMKERESDILEILVRTYIRTPQPVGSQYIARHLRPPLSPASVRNVIVRLAEKGYLEQPHTSAGRKPTQKAYRFFVNSLLGRAGWFVPRRNVRRLERDIERLRELSRKLRVVAGVLGDGFEAGPWGFEEVFSRPEFSFQEMAIEFGHFFDRFQNARESYQEALGPNQFMIFIGRENPLDESEHISTVLKTTLNDEIIFIAGPLRLDYEKIIEAFYG